MGALLDYLPIINDKDHVTVHDGAESMGDGDSRPLFADLV